MKHLKGTINTSKGSHTVFGPIWGYLIILNSQHVCACEFEV